MTADLPTASGLWAQSNPAKKAWSYKDKAKPTATGIAGDVDQGEEVRHQCVRREDHRPRRGPERRSRRRSASATD